jgi:RNA polymerase sigma factor (TIGR02999 family)
MTPSPHEVTQLLLDWSNGNQAALDKLMPLVYGELHRLAHQYMNRERPGHTLQTSGLVNEAYLRLVDQREVHWQNRAHFFGIAAQLMRRILVDYARSRHFAKRGGDAWQVSFDEAVIVSPERATEVVALDDALKRLAVIDERKSQIVEFRFFGGLSIEETAEVLKVSPGTIMRDWTLAKAWLRKEMIADNRELR